MTGDLKFALSIYSRAKTFVATTGFLWETEWQRTRQFSEFTETDLLRETAWVILCTGFREAVVRRVFNHISLCFYDWESAKAITKHATICRATALASFGNTRKIDAIIEAARRIEQISYRQLKDLILRDPVSELQRFPYIGPVTSWHLAKNLGLQVAKPDRHMTRYSAMLGFKDAHDLCRAVSNATGEAISVVDVVLWRYAASGRE